MLGFSAFSEAPIAQSTTTSSALAFSPWVSSDGLANNVSFSARALKISPNVFSSFTSGNLLYDAKSIAPIEGTTTEVQIDNVNTSGTASGVASSVISAFTLGILDYNGIAYITTTSANSNNLIGSLDFDAKSNTTIAYVTTNLYYNNLVSKAKATYSADSVSAIVQHQSLNPPTTADFNYQNISDSYDRNRTVYILSDDKRHVVYINQEPSNIIHLGNQDTNRIVRITA